MQEKRPILVFPALSGRLLMEVSVPDRQDDTSFGETCVATVLSFVLSQLHTRIR